MDGPILDAPSIAERQLERDEGVLAVEGHAAECRGSSSPSSTRTGMQYCTVHTYQLPVSPSYCARSFQISLECDNSIRREAIR